MRKYSHTDGREDTASLTIETSNPFYLPNCIFLFVLARSAIFWTTYWLYSFGKNKNKKNKSEYKQQYLDKTKIKMFFLASNLPATRPCYVQGARLCETV